MEICNFEIAKKLKEKGFNKNCSSFYALDNFTAEYIDDCGDAYEVDFEKGELYLNYPIKSTKFKDKMLDAPTIYQVLKWLREKKKYHIEFVGNACGYLFIISDVPSEGGTDRYCSDYSGPNDGGTWDKYEDCAIASIEYVLDNLI